MAAAAVVLMVIDHEFRRFCEKDVLILISLLVCGKGNWISLMVSSIQCLSSVVVFGSEFTGQMTDERNLLADTNTCSMFCRVHAAALLSLQERN